MNPIIDKLRLVEEKIHALGNGSPTIMAVSKTRTFEEIESAYQAGIRDFGENYLQEALEKLPNTPHKDINWHFIGPIQSNKCKAISEHFQWVHSVDRVKIAQKLNQYAGAQHKVLNICLQVNLDGEISKAGFTPEDLLKQSSHIAELPNINIRGLMAIPKKREKFDEQRTSFARIALLFAELKQKSELKHIDTLSMGMSGDYEAAVSEGATIIRLGTCLFGPRE